MHHKTLAAASVITLAFSLSSCAAFSDDSSPTSTDGTYTVTTSFYPITWLTEQIGGEYVTVTSITPPNVEPHEYELSPKEVTELEKTQAVIYASGFQPALDKTLEEVKDPHVLDLSTSLDLLPNEEAEHEDEHGEHEHGEHEHGEHSGHDHGAYDPHFWLDPNYMIEAGAAITAMLEENDPEHAEEYHANFENLKSELETLDAEFTQGLKECQTRVLISDHAAFGYLAHAYNLQPMPMSLDAETETSPARLKELSDVIKEKKVSTIFTEEGAQNGSTEALAQEAGVKTDAISTLERAPQDSDYLEVMRNNLQSIRKGLVCE